MGTRLKVETLKLEKAPPLNRASKGADIIDLFSDEPDISGCAIVDQDQIPIGYVDRTAFVTRVSSLYGRALYDNRPAETLATQNYRIIAFDSEIGDAIAIEDCGAELDRSTGLVVVDADGRYLGLTHAFALTQALLNENRSLVGELKHEIAERQAAERAVRDMAERDELTGLYNRRRFMADLEARIAAETPTLLIYLDLDKFKHVNDTYGHAAGDFVLSTIAARLQERVGDGIVARLGGDEIAVMQDAITDPGALSARLLQLEAAIVFPIKRASGVLEVGTSMGAAQFPRHFTDAASLIDGADRAMLEAKVNGGGFRIYGASENGSPVIAGAA